MKKMHESDCNRPGTACKGFGHVEAEKEDYDEIFELDDVELIRETEKALLVWSELFGETWVPRSQVDSESDLPDRPRGSLLVRRWWARRARWLEKAREAEEVKLKRYEYTYEEWEAGNRSVVQADWSNWGSKDIAESAQEPSGARCDEPESSGARRGERGSGALSGTKNRRRVGQV